MLTTIFLDNDGVLVDTEKHYFTANRELCRKHGYALTRGKGQDFSKALDVKATFLEAVKVIEKLLKVNGR